MIDIYQNERVRVFACQLIITLNQRIRMRMSCDESSDLSKYFQTEDKSSLYNYSTSHNNETLLLQTTDIYQRPSNQAKETSLLEDLYEQLEVTLEQSQLKSEPDLQAMCRQLVASLKKLESKVDRMEEQEAKGRHLQKDSRADEREVESVLTYSSKGSKVCRCEEKANPISNILELVQQRSKLDIYRQEKEALQRQVVRLQVANQDLRKQLRKLQGENLKVKELLKQYQNLNRKQTSREDYYDEVPLQNFYRFTHTRCNTVQEIDQQQPSWKRALEKENIKLLYDRKLKEEESRGGFNKQPPMTPNPLLRTSKSQHQLQSTESKWACHPSRPTQHNQRAQHHFDMDNQKTESKSKERRAIVRGATTRGSPKYGSNAVLEQNNYHAEEKMGVLDHVDTMTSLPENSPPSFFELKRIQSSKSLLCSPEKLSPLRVLPKPYRR